MNLEELQNELREAIAMVGGALKDLENAESCESISDFKANIKAAKESLQNAILEIEYLQAN